MTFDTYTTFTHDFIPMQHVVWKTHFNLTIQSTQKSVSGITKMLDQIQYLLLNILFKPHNITILKILLILD